MPPLRLAVLGDLDGSHTWRWLRVFIERGHDVHAISFYPPLRDLPGLTVHVLRPAAASSLADADKPATGRRSRLVGALPPSPLRLVHALRYRRAGLNQAILEIRPDVLHSHYVVEHGFYGSLAGFHPYVVSAWGSDLFRAPSTLAGRLIARRALRAADLVTANDPDLAERARRLGAPPDRVEVIRLGVDAVYLEPGPPCVNTLPAGSAPLTVLSDRALEPLYNVDIVIQSFARLKEDLSGARLVVAGDGSEHGRLEALAGALRLGDAVRFVGHVDPPALRKLLAEAHVYVSVPSSDSLSVSTMEAMAVGAFPVVSDLASQDGWIRDHVTGLRVPPGDVRALSSALALALRDENMRRGAVGPNRAKVEADGALEKNMLEMERLYYRLAGQGAADARSS